MFNFLLDNAAKFGHMLVKRNNISLTDEEFVIKTITSFRLSKRRKDMIDGERYYDGLHDILKRKRTVIGEGGDLEEVKNLPNNRIVDNQYKKMVDQKNNYLLGQPISIRTDNDNYSKILQKFFNKKFQRLMKNIGEDSLNNGIGWMFIYYDEKGQFNFKRFKPSEIIPLWKDVEHTILEGAIRVYETVYIDKNEEKIIQKVEIYEEKGIYFFTLESGKLIPDKIPFKNYFNVVSLVDGQEIEQGYNWSKIPLIPFKYNSKEIPLLKMVKSLQDGLNTILSNFENNMEEDARNTILVLVNYDGQNLGEFRKNLATYGAVKVKTIDGAAGDLKTLQVEVNCDNYKAIIEIFKKAIIENAMGYDAKDDRLGGNANQMNIQSMYSDIDLDANSMETEYQASFEDLLWFINVHLYNNGFGDFENEDVEVIFNRDILINESEVIDNISKSIGIISDETNVSMHPYVDDPLKELQRIKEEKEQNVEQYGNAFMNKSPTTNKGGDDLNGEEE